MTNSAARKTNVRLSEFDWLRAFAFFLLIVIHSAMPFFEYDFPVKNSETDATLTSIFMGFTHLWRLPLLFTISGMGVWFAFRKRSPGEFICERIRRLLLPLVVCTFLVSPYQGYFQALQQGTFSGSYLDFLPGYLSNFPPSTFHLWFLVNLFVFCFALVPVIIFLKSEKGKVVLDYFIRNADSKRVIFPVTLPFVLADPLARMLPGRFMVSWQDNAVYALIMLAGVVIASRPELMDSLMKQRHYHLLLCALSFSGYFYALSEPALKEIYWIVLPLESLSRVAIILTILGYGRKYLAFSNRFIEYSNQAIYPFYLLHQTISVALAFYVVQLDLGIYPKLGLILSGTMLFTWAVYHLLIRPFNVVRPLFGMKLKS